MKTVLNGRNMEKEGKEELPTFDLKNACQKPAYFLILSCKSSGKSNLVFDLYKEIKIHTPDITIVDSGVDEDEHDKLEKWGPGAKVVSTVKDIEYKELKDPSKEFQAFIIEEKWLLEPKQVKKVSTIMSSLSSYLVATCQILPEIPKKLRKVPNFWFMGRQEHEDDIRMLYNKFKFGMADFGKFKQLLLEATEDCGFLVISFDSFDPVIKLWKYRAPFYTFHRHPSKLSEKMF